MSRREQIKMSEQEVLGFLREQRAVTCATLGPRGWPHLMPLWYVLRETADGGQPRIWSWTYAASQKVRNLERDPRATLQVESGSSYEELRGVMFECDVVVHRELDSVAGLGAEIMLRYSVPPGVEPPAEMPSAAREMIDKQAPKRVGLEFVELRRSTWDHRKLAGVY